MVDVTSAARHLDRIEGVQKRDRAITRAGLQRINGETPARTNGSVDGKLHPATAEIAKVQAYLGQLDKDRPVGNVTLVGSVRGKPVPL